MKLWKLESNRDRPEWSWPYDKKHGYVIRAASEREARKMASTHASDEGSAVWRDPESTTCVQIDIDGDPEVLMIDFCAG